MNNLNSKASDTNFRRTIGKKLVINDSPYRAKFKKFDNYSEWINTLNEENKKIANDLHNQVISNNISKEDFNKSLRKFNF